MSRRRRSPLLAAALAAATVAGGLAVALPARPAAAAPVATTEWVPAPDPSGSFRQTANDKPFVSADGRWVAFQSTPPTGGQPGVFLSDRATDTVIPVAGGAPAALPAVSADGCFVVFVTSQPLDPTVDRNDRPDVYRYTRG